MIRGGAREGGRLFVMVRAPPCWFPSKEQAGDRWKLMYPQQSLISGSHRGEGMEREEECVREKEGTVKYTENERGKEGRGEISSNAA